MAEATISTPADPERGYQRTTFDSTHSFVSSFVYMLPWGPDGKWLREGALGKALGDWQVTGVVSAISGTPIDFTASADGSARAWQFKHAERHRNAGSAGRHRVGRALVRHVSVLRAGGQLVGQRRAARSAEWARVLQPRRLDREGHPRSERGAPRSVRTSSTRSTSRTTRIRTARSAMRTSAASRASCRRPNARFGSAGVSCSSGEYVTPSRRGAGIRKKLIL